MLAITRSLSFTIDCSERRSPCRANEQIPLLASPHVLSHPDPQFRVFLDSCLSSHPQTPVPFRVQFKVPPPPKSLCFLTLLYCLLLKSPAQNFITARVVLRHSVVSNYCDPRDCSPQGSSVHEILQARLLEWVAIPFSKGSS